MRKFSTNRLFHLVLGRLRSDALPWAIGAGILVGVELLSLVLSVLLHEPGGLNPPEETLVPGLVVLGCWLTSSRAFRAMQSPKSTTDWLLLPASASEKYGAALVETQVVVPVLASLAGLVFLLVTGHMEWHVAYLEWRAWGLFMVVNLFFLAGSTVFRKAVFLKTAGVLVGFAVVLGALLAEGMTMLNDSLFIQSTAALGLEVGGDQAGPQFLGLSTSFSGPSSLLSSFLVLFWQAGVYLVAPAAALAFGYFRVVEKEARDAVQ